MSKHLLIINLICKKLTNFVLLYCHNMKRLYLFNPENDLALAVNSPYFTPPSAAVRLARAAACLPVWYASDGDYVLASKESRVWVESISKKFNINVDIVDSAPADVAVVSPWGWSRYSRELFRRVGVDEALLPTDDRLDRYRECSHRRMTIKMHSCLEHIGLPYPLPPIPQEVSSTDIIEKNLENGCQMFLKSPLSGSGRGVLDSMSAPARQILRLAAGVIKHQGSIIVEPRLNKIADFAMLYDMVGGKAIFAGYSYFFNAGYSTYSGNELMSDDAIMETLCRYGVDSKWLELTKVAVGVALERTFGAYCGPVGVDMMIYRNNDMVLIAPCVEVNTRMTMGRVANILNRRFVSEGKVGVMEIQQNPDSSSLGECHIVDGRLDSGAVYMTPPAGHDFAFVIKIRE